MNEWAFFIFEAISLQMEVQLQMYQHIACYLCNQWLITIVHSPGASASFRACCKCSGHA